MSVRLYRKGKQKKVQGFLVDRLDCVPERVEELCDKGWHRTPRAAYALPMPAPVAEKSEMIGIPKPKKAYVPLTNPKKKSKKD